MASRRVQRDWPAVVRAFTASGQSVAAFCRDQSISTSLLYRWRRRCPDEAEPSTSLNGFVELRPVDRPVRGSGVAVVVDGSWRLEVKPGFDTATLEQVLACVERRSACSP